MAERYGLQIGEQIRPPARARFAPSVGPDDGGASRALPGLAGGIQALSAAALRKEEELDMLAVEEAMNEYTKRMLDYTNNPETGILNSPAYRFGKARGLTGKFEADSKNMADEIAETLKGPKAQNAFMRLALKGSMPFYKAAQEYESSQMTAFKDSQTQATIENWTQPVLNNPLDDETFQTSAGFIAAAIELQMDGAPPEAAKLTVAKTLSDLDEARIRVVMGNDPMTAREMIRKSENLSPQARAGLENAVRGEAERVKTQEIAEGIAARFGTDAAGAEKALRYIDGRYKGLERDRIKSEYNFNVAEADRIENMRERENAEAQRKVFLGIAESFVAGERAPSPVEIDRLFADGKISLEQHETLARWQENSVTRAGITKRLSRAAPGWYDMTPQQQEEAVMREAGRTQDDRDATLSYIESAIIDGSLTDAELTAAYNNMYITSSEKEEYKKAIGRYAAYGKEVLGVYKGKLNESLNRVLDNLSGETETSNATLRAIATAAFYEGTVNLDPKDAKYEEKVSEAARAALGAVIDETGEPMTSRSFPKLWETVQSAFAGVAEEAYSNIASGSGIAPPSFRRDPISLIIESEGGYVNNPADRGGETNMGITKATLDAAYKDGIVPHNDVKNLTRQEALEIYKKRYYEPIRYNELPWGVNYMVLDMAVLHGVSGGVKMLQDVLGVKRTGRMDDDTIEAANHALPGDVIAALSLKRRAKFASIVAGNKTQVRFWPGWKNRDKNVREKAMEMAASPDDTARAVLFGTSEDDY